MNKIVCLLLVIFTGSLQAQIKIGKNDVPNIGDNIQYSNASTQGLNFNARKTGANQNWDFSNLKPTSQGIYSYVSSLSTPYLAYFFNTIGLKTQDTLDLLLLKFSNLHDFYKKTDTKFSIVGRGFSYQGLPLPANFEIEDQIYNFPLKYADKDSTPFYFKLSDPTGTLPIRYAQTGWRVSQVDGWGKITTPYGSFDCLRLKTKLITTDSITILGFTIPINRTTYEYRWLTNGERIPVLQINGNETFGTFTPSSVIYRDIPRALKPIADFTYTDTRGEPGYEITFSDISKNNPTEWIWDVNPPYVTYMWGTNPGSQYANIRFDSIGVYDISLKAINKGGIGERVRKGLVQIAAAPVGFSTLSGEHFKMYPNPASSLLNIELDLPHLGTLVTIFDLEGREIYSKIQMEPVSAINTSSLAAGQYIIKLTKGSRQDFRVFVKQ